MSTLCLRHQVEANHFWYSIWVHRWSLKIMMLGMSNIAVQKRDIMPPSNLPCMGPMAASDQRKVWQTLWMRHQNSQYIEIAKYNAVTLSLVIIFSRCWVFSMTFGSVMSWWCSAFSITFNSTGQDFIMSYCCSTFSITFCFTM